MSLTTYQQEAVEWLTRHRRGIVQCPAGGGKTRIGVAAIYTVAMAKPRPRHVRVTWLANTTEQCDQAKAELRRFSELERVCRIRVACWQGRPDLREEDLVVVDECHHTAAPTLQGMLARAPKAIWGLSATPFSSDPEKTMAILRTFNFKKHVVPRHTVVEAGRLTAAVVHWHTDTDAGTGERVAREAAVLLNERMLHFPRLDRDEQRRRIVWQLAQKYCIAGNRLRNDRIVQLALANRDGSTLILVGTVTHGEALSQHIPGAVVCHSKLGKVRREKVIGDFRAGMLRCMIATSLADEGFDAPICDTLILACGGRSEGKAEQRTGRVLRAREGKRKGTIHDFRDEQHEMLRQQSKARERLYKRLGYEITEPTNNKPTLNF